MQITTSRPASGITKDRVSARVGVAPGAALLDQFAPKWWATFDSDRLDITVLADSPLGQALGPTAARNFLSDRHNTAWAVVYDLYVGSDTPLDEDTLCATEDQWRVAVTTRRAAAPVGGGW